MVSRCLSAASFCFLDHRVPLGRCAAVAVGLLPYRAHALSLRADPIGVSTFRTREMRPGWVSSILRGRGVLLQGERDSCSTCGPSSSPSLLTTDSSDPKSRSLFNDSLAFTRPAFPLPGLSGWFALPFGFILGFAPRRYQRRTPGLGTGLGHSPDGGLSSTALTRRDLVSRHNI